MNWAALVKASPAVEEVAAAPAAPEAGVPGVQRQAVVDANAIISGLSLRHLADRFVTIQEVLNEVRDKQSRQFLANLPIGLAVAEPSEESLRAVTVFARETGDAHALSATDLKLLALAHTLEVEAHGAAHLRQHPSQARPMPFAAPGSALALAVVKPRHRSRGQGLPNWGRVPNPADWAAVDAAADDDPGQQQGTSRIAASTQALDLNSSPGFNVFLPGSDVTQPAPTAAAATSLPYKTFGDAALAAAQASQAFNSSQAGASRPGSEESGPGQAASAQADASLTPAAAGQTALQQGTIVPGMGSAPCTTPSACALAASSPESKPGQNHFVYQGVTYHNIDGDEEGEEEAEEEEEEGGWVNACKSRNSHRRRQRKQLRWEARQEWRRQAAEAAAAAAAADAQSRGEGVGGAAAAGAHSQQAMQPLCTGAQKAEQEGQQGPGQGQHSSGDESAARLAGLVSSHMKDLTLSSLTAVPEERVNEEEGVADEESGDEGEEGDDDDDEGGSEGAEARGGLTDGESSHGDEVSSVAGEGAATEVTLSESGVTFASGTDCGETRVNTTSTVLSVTGDFAMQNVLLQMGLRLVTRDGRQISRLSRWALRCSACFFVTKEAGRLFCPRCGNMALERVEVVVGAGGAEFFGVRKNHTLRGTRFSLPKPKGGRAKNPILCEDELLARIKQRKQRPGRAVDAALNSFTPEFGSDTWHKAHAASQAALVTDKGAAYLLKGWKNNPNERKNVASNRRRNYLFNSWVVVEARSLSSAGASGSGQQVQGQGKAAKVVIAERRQVIKAGLRGLVKAALPDFSPAQVDAIVAEINKRQSK
ncbi:hypothetical protein QJQ45_022704 [Haematococcus lacustris]|nr:hypothetical protein QJQ45_022704 [Haematococcus lacustris]